MELREQITGVQHLGIPVLDVKAAADWYEETLGFTRVYEKTVWYPAKWNVVFVKLGDLLIELYQPSGRDLEQIRTRGDGILDHFAIDAPDLDTIAGILLAKGLKLHASTPDGIVDYWNIGAQGVRGINFLGPNREVLELCQNLSHKYKGLGLQGWSHLAVKVRDLEASMNFYQGLGFEKTDSGYLDTPEGRLQIGFVGNHGFELELIQMIGSGLEELKTRGAGHLDHIALNVEDAKEAFFLAKKEGYQLEDYTVHELPLFEHGVRFFTVLGPDGERVELNQICRF